MRRSYVAPLMLAVLSLGTLTTLPRRAAASAITWGTPQTIAADTDISTAGVLLGAFDFNTGATVNTVPFKAYSLGTPNFTLSPVDTGVNEDSATPPFGSLSPAYHSILRASDGNDAGPLVLTMTGLTPGSNYEFEWWLNATNANSGVFNSTATAGNSVTLVSNTTRQDGGVGQFAIGTLTADLSGQQSITFTGTGSWQITAFELRQLPVSVPEPNGLSVFLLGLACLFGAALRNKLRNA